MKAMLYIVIISALIISTALAADTPLFKPRTWTAKSGTTIEATLVKQDKYNAVLRKSDGSVVGITPSSLSKEDQAYLAQASEYNKYIGQQYSTEILECKKLKFECHPSGFLVVSTFVYDSDAGGGTASILPDHNKLIPALEKGIEWCRTARETNAESESRDLLYALGKKAGCLDGYTITFSSNAAQINGRGDALRARSERGALGKAEWGSIGGKVVPEVRVSIYKEAFPYSQSAYITLDEKDLITIVTALKKVPFDLVAEYTKAKDAKSNEIFK